MGNLPTGTGQIIVSGVRNEIIEEFKKLMEIQGPVRRKRKSWEVFEMIWEEWKESKNSRASPIFHVADKHGHYGGAKADEITLASAEGGKKRRGVRH